jgi:hypothetical protein
MTRGRGSRSRLACASHGLRGQASFSRKSLQAFSNLYNRRSFSSTIACSAPRVLLSALQDDEGAALLAPATSRSGASACRGRVVASHRHSCSWRNDRSPILSGDLFPRATCVFPDPGRVFPRSGPCGAGLGAREGWDLGKTVSPLDRRKRRAP